MNETFQFEETRVFKITKNGNQVILDEDEMKKLLTRHEVKRLLNEMIQKETAGLTKFVTENVLYPISKGYEKFHEASCDPRSPFDHTFVYFKNHSSGEYAFISVEENGKESPFRKIGRISDSNSIIGSFIRAMPKDGNYYTKTELASLGIPLAKNDGRKLKAVLDVLTFERYLHSKPLLDKGGRIGYIRTSKMDGIEGMTKDEPLKEVQTIPHIPSQ